MIVVQSLRYWASGKRALSEYSAHLTNFSYYTVPSCLCLFSISFPDSKFLLCS